jgi:Family of unknown function (DUF6932)
VIPPFDTAGNLPAGIHHTTRDELTARLGHTSHRRELLAGLRRALDSLGHAGCRRVYVDGSFVTAKETPADFDACWEVSIVDPMLLDPTLLDFSNARQAQEAKLGGELFPAEVPAKPGGMRFLEYFQHDKDTGASKGILSLDLNELP